MPQNNNNNMPKNLEIVPFIKEWEHLRRHFGGQVMGSKIVRELQDQETVENIIIAFLKEAEGNFKASTMARSIYARNLEENIATAAVVNRSAVDEDAIFVAPREPEVSVEQEVNIAIIRDCDLPTTNRVYAIFGPYRDSGKAGIYTAFFGRLGRPFTDTSYWTDHIFLATESEIEYLIMKLEEKGLNAEADAVKERLKAFQKAGRRNPIIGQLEDYALDEEGEQVIEI